MTRIALISEHASPAALLGGVDAGGQNVYVDEIARALADLGFDVDVITRRDSESAPEIQPWADGVRILNLAAGPVCPMPKDEMWSHMPAMRDQLIRFAVRHNLKYDLVHGNFWMSGWVASELRVRRHIPAVQLFHALGVTKRLHQGRDDTSPDERIDIERGVIRKVDRVIATCPDELNQLVSHYQAPRPRVTMIPLGVDAATFRPVDKLAARARIGFGLGPDDRVIAYVGRIVPRKGIRTIVHALAQLTRNGEDDIKLLIVGGETEVPDPIATPEIGELQRLAEKLGMSKHVIIAGKRAQHELADYYGAADVMVTTPWYEPFGLTPLEGMACGRPVIGSNVGGIAFTVEPGKTGLLVPPEDPAALARELQYVLGNRQLAIQMGERGRQRIEREFTWNVVARRTADLYADVLECASSSTGQRTAVAGA